MKHTLRTMALCLWLLIVSLPVRGEVEPVIEHRLRMRIDPAAHRLDAEDLLLIPRTLVSGDGLHLRLAAGLAILSVAVPAAPDASPTVEPCPVHPRPDGSATGLACARIAVAAGPGAVELRIVYGGVVHHPPRQDETMRFVVGDKTAGTIGPEGVYLAGGSGVTPEFASSGPLLHRFRVEIDVPEPWQGVGQGARVAAESRDGRHLSTWENPVPCDGLSVVAGPYVVETREWNGITLATFLFEEDRRLAPAYLDAAQTFLAFYSELLCPYPYRQFSIVENFFATGYGMPGYTLLGREVVKMAERYTGAVGLGHEILHCWWGNYVLAGATEENWCEGLTTYCANYLYEEKTQGAERAREYRRHTSARFSILVPVGQDYPVRKFVGKVNEIDNEVGYGKCSMIFHQVRMRLGDDRFFGALRQVLARHGGRHASWDDFRRAFEEAGEIDLADFFAQWLDRPGAPVIASVVRTDLEPGPAGAARVRIEVRQAPEEVAVRAPDEEGRHLVWEDPGFKPWRMRIPVRVHTSRRVFDRALDGGAPEGAVEIELEPGESIDRVEVDPDFHVFRRLRRDELAPCLNLTLHSEKRIAVLPAEGPAPLLEAYRGIGERLRAEPGWTVLESAAASDEALAGASLLLLGTPATNPVVARLAASLDRAQVPTDTRAAVKLGARLEFEKDAIRIGGQSVTGPDGAVLINLHNPWSRGRTVSVFAAFDAAGAARPARLLFYYGWDGYLVWQQGQVVERGQVTAPPAELALDFVKR